MGFMCIQMDQKLPKRCDHTFITEIAHTPEEAATLVEAGFEWVGQKEGLIFLRKRK
jgi:hypothetical protein